MGNELALDVNVLWLLILSLFLCPSSPPLRGG